MFHFTERLVLLHVCALVASAQQYNVSTYAGGAMPPTPVAGVTTPIGIPGGVAVDSTGNAYFTGLNSVFKIDVNGILTHVAGQRTQTTYGGDGGLAINAQLNQPTGIAVDASGNLFIADTANTRVRKISSAGIITTVAGNGIAGTSGDGGLAVNAELLDPVGVAVDGSGNVYISDASEYAVRKVTADGIITTAFSTISGGPPHVIAVDQAGDVYFSTTYEENVRKFSPGQYFTVVAGDNCNGCPQVNGVPATSTDPGTVQALALDSAGNLFIGSGYGTPGRVSEVPAATGIINTIAGGNWMPVGSGEPATNAAIYQPSGVAVDSDDDVFIADQNGFNVRKVTAGIISTIAGNGIRSGDNGPATSAFIGYPDSVALDGAGNIYLSGDGSSIRKVSAAGIITTVVGSRTTTGFSGDGGPATSALLDLPGSIAFDSGGNLYIVDSANYRIRKVSPAGIITTIAGTGTRGYTGDGGPALSAEVSFVSSIALDNTGNLYLADEENFVVRKISTDGTISTVAGNGMQGSSGNGGPATSAKLSYAFQVAVDSSGMLYISDGLNGVRKVSASGTISSVVKSAVGSGIAIDPAGNVYFGLGPGIGKTSGGGTFTTIAGNGTTGYLGDGGPALNAEFNSVSDLASDNAGNIYVADQNNGAIRLLLLTADTPPFGSFDTPAATSNGNGSVAFTGWALSSAGITYVDLWREPNPDEGTGLVYIGQADSVVGTRPDIASKYPSYPENVAAGWGYLMLTNELPANNGFTGVGNGTYSIHAIAHDKGGKSTDLGMKTIVVDNIDATAPFGSIDTPAQGATISGPAYVNFGWALTPIGKMIPIDGSTIWVYIDGQPVGHPVYNNPRVDIETLFPGYANTDGAVGYYYLDTTQLANGLHTISWSVKDNMGAASGIGSRYFIVQN